MELVESSSVALAVRSQSQPDRFHFVSPPPGWSCDCKDFLYRTGYCKHTLAARAAVGQWMKGEGMLSARSLSGEVEGNRLLGVLKTQIPQSKGQVAHTRRGPQICKGTRVEREGTQEDVGLKQETPHSPPQ